MCEFCGTSNGVDIMDEEKPSKEDTTFLITPATVEGGGAVGGVSSVGDAMVIFCIDISGSMCVTTEVRELNHVPCIINPCAWRGGLLQLVVCVCVCVCVCVRLSVCLSKDFLPIRSSYDRKT